MKRVNFISEIEAPIKPTKREVGIRKAQRTRKTNYRSQIIEKNLKRVDEALDELNETESDPKIKLDHMKPLLPYMFEKPSQKIDINKRVEERSARIVVLKSESDAIKTIEQARSESGLSGALAQLPEASKDDACRDLFGASEIKTEDEIEYLRCSEVINEDAD